MPASFSEKKNYHSIGYQNSINSKIILLTENWLIIKNVYLPKARATWL
jgi:hypothetical protein